MCSFVLRFDRWELGWDKLIIQDATTYECFYSDLPDPNETPDHYLNIDPNMPYCVVEDGYSGRDHGNGGGIPPDGPIRTNYGLFPGGGQWDNDAFNNVQNSGVDGALGEGIAPILTSYMVDFMRAEVALTGGSSEDARALLESGVRGSIAKVRGFASKIGAEELSFKIGFDPINMVDILAETLLTTDDDVEEYVAFVLDTYDNATNKLDVVMKEYYISLAGNAYEAYNMYRRTGMPLNIQPGLDPAIGSFPRSLLYPSDNVNLNANATQKSDLQQLVFWDDGSAQLR